MSAIVSYSDSDRLHSSHEHYNYMVWHDNVNSSLQLQIAAVMSQSCWLPRTASNRILAGSGSGSGSGSSSFTLYSAKKEGL